MRPPAPPSLPLCPPGSHPRAHSQLAQLRPLQVQHRCCIFKEMYFFCISPQMVAWINYKIILLSPNKSQRTGIRGWPGASMRFPLCLSQALTHTPTSTGQWPEPWLSNLYFRQEKEERDRLVGFPILPLGLVMWHVRKCFQSWFHQHSRSSGEKGQGTSGRDHVSLPQTT